MASSVIPAPGGRVRTGLIPPLAPFFSQRPETAPRLTPALIPGAVAVVVPDLTGSAWQADNRGQRDLYGYGEQNVTQAPGQGDLAWHAITGKTQLAVAFAETLWRRGDITLLAWTDAASRQSVLSGYARAAAGLFGQNLAGDTDAVAAHLLDWLATTSQPWLMVLDGLRSSADLAGLWPVGPAGMVLITAADQTVVPRGLRPVPLSLGAMSVREAMTYLKERLASELDQRAGMMDLATELGGEPMAMAQASGVIRTSAMSSREYLTSFRAQRAKLMTTTGDSPPASAVTWLLSGQHAHRMSRGLGWPVLSLAAMLDGYGIPASVFGTVAAGHYIAELSQSDPPLPRDLNASLEALATAGLIEVVPALDPPLIRMNRTLQATIRKSLPGGVVPRAAVTAADALLEIWPKDDPGDWPAEALRACASRLFWTVGDLLWANGCHPVLLCAGDSLDVAGMRGPAVTYWGELADVAQRQLGLSHPDAVRISARFAAAYQSAGNAAQAVSIYRDAAARLSAVLGADHPDVIALRMEVGGALTAAGRPEEAAVALARAVSDYERVLGPSHLDTIRAREQHAAAYLAAGRTNEACTLYRRVTADRERAQGARHPDTIASRYKLAAACLTDGQFKEAITNYKKVLADRERVLGPDNLDTIATRGDLGAAYHAAGRTAAAVQMEEEALAGYRRALGDTNPQTLARCVNVAHAYYALGRITDATTLLRETLERCEQVLPPGDSLIRTVKESLANITGRAG